MTLTKTEEDYLKALFYLIIESGNERVGSSQLAEYLDISPASVSSMLKKLKAKALVSYEKYGKLALTQEGEGIAIWLIRKHRLWETFLCNHMNFKWEEVHDVAEQLEHIQSPKLILELDKFLGYPEKDPHGALIPNQKGEYKIIPKVTLSSLAIGDRCRLTSVKDSSVSFLQYVSKIGLVLSSEVFVEDIQGFDQSMLIAFDGKKVTISKKFADNVFVEQIAIP